MKIIKKIQKKIWGFFSKQRFQKSLKQEKKKLYLSEPSPSKYTSRREKFKLFSSKLEFENTFFEKKDFNLIYYIIWVFLILCSGYILLFSHYFSVKSIEIYREDEGINIELSYRSLERYRYKPMLLSNKQSIHANLIAHQPNIQQVYIRKVLPDTLAITLKSFPTLFGFHYWDTYYHITQNGVMVPTREDENTKKIQVIGLGNIWIVDYKKVFGEFYINKIHQTIQLIWEQSSFIEVHNVLYYIKEQEVHIFDQNGTRIIFDLNQDLAIQVDKLNIFNKKYLSTLQSWIIYIDLRILDRIIYCGRESEFQCKQNITNIYGS